MRILKDIREIKSFLRRRKICIVTSTPLLKKFSAVVRDLTLYSQSCFLMTVPDGERAKDWKVLEQILRKFSSSHLDRRSVVIALGGGSVGDLGGFAAAVYLRGVDFINIPTTLLAQVDSAHGGKTGINFAGYKNQVGTFRAPVAIVLDPRFLTTLGEDRLIDGLGEILKAGFIKDHTILQILRKYTLRNLARDRKTLALLVKKSVAVKYYYTRRDPTERGERALLNVGHTFGHAIELQYGMSHGRAVIVGMLQEFACTEKLGLSGKGLTNVLESLLETLGISIQASAYRVSKKAILHDKKVAGHTIQFPIVKKAGVSYVHTLPIKNLF